MATKGAEHRREHDATGGRHYEGPAPPTQKASDAPAKRTVTTSTTAFTCKPRGRGWAAEDKREHVVLVLGDSHLNISRARVREAIAVYDGLDYRNRKLLLTGTKREADAMLAVAREHGLSRLEIEVDSEALNTADNIKNAERTLSGLGATDIYIVTSRFQKGRAVTYTRHLEDRYRIVDIGVRGKGHDFSMQHALLNVFVDPIMMRVEFFRDYVARYADKARERTHTFLDRLQRR